MLKKWDLVDGSSREDLTQLIDRFSRLPKGRKVKYVKCNSTVLLLLLIKLIYYKVIPNGKHIKNLQLFLSDENVLKECPLIISRQILTDKLIMNKHNSLTISNKNLMKCLRILSGFQIITEYSHTLNYAYSSLFSDVDSINNYIKTIDKYVTKSFVKNFEKIDNLRISERLEKTAKNYPIIFFRDNKIMENKNDYYTVNSFESFDKIADWLLERCKHIETFEIGVFAAVSQTLGITEGLEAFEKFVKYAESLDDNNRINLINKLIAYYNNFNNTKGHASSNLVLIPNIIKSLNLCEYLNDYPESVIKSVVDANISNQLLEEFTEIVKSADKNRLVEAIQALKNNVKNFPKSSKFGRDNTLPMQNIINKYYSYNE